jgi:hypothetical protein
MGIIDKLISKERMEKLIDDYLREYDLPNKYPSDDTKWKVIVEKGGTKDTMLFESEYYFKEYLEAKSYARNEVTKGNKIEIWKLFHKW